MESENAQCLLGFKSCISLTADLAFREFDSYFTVKTDASASPHGAVLAQKKADGKIHRFQYASRTMKAAERN